MSDVDAITPKPGRQGLALAAHLWGAGQTAQQRARYSIEQMVVCPSLAYRLEGAEAYHASLTRFATSDALAAMRVSPGAWHASGIRR